MASKYVSRRLREARKAAGLTQREVYTWLGVGQSTFSAWETGQGEPSVEVFLRLCQKYRIVDIASYFLPDPDTGLTARRIEPDFADRYLSLSRRSQEAVRNCLDFEFRHSAAEVRPTGRRLRRLPLYAQSAAAGRGNYNDAADAELHELEAPEEASFAVRIAGDSMEPLIHDGDIVFVRSQPKLESGQIGIFTCNGESYCKLWENRDGIPRLVSINKAYAPILLRPSDQLVVHGRVLL